VISLFILAIRLTIKMFVLAIWLLWAMIAVTVVLIASVTGNHSTARQWQRSMRWHRVL
jgi:hypothetical protein